MNYTEAIRLALAGEQKAFNVLYEKTFQKQFLSAYGYMKNKMAAEDVVQEAYIKAFSKLDTLEKPETFPAWLGIIVANTAKNALKKNNPMLFSDIAADEYQEEFEYQIEDENIEHMPEDAYTRKETRQLAHKLMNSLSDEQRMCILMYHIEGMSIRQIASALNCSENTVKSRLKYGRDNIKAKGEELQKKGYQLYSVAPLPLLLYLLGEEAAYMKTDGFLGAAGARIAQQVIPSFGEHGRAGVSGRKHRTAGRGAKAVKSGFIHTAAGKAVAAAVVLCLVGGTIVYGVSQRNTKENTDKPEVTDNQPEVKKEEPEVKIEEETPAAAVKEVQDAEYGALIAGNLTKEELQFVLAYGPSEIPEQGFQSKDYLDILNSLCDASGRNESGPMIEEYGPDANWRGQYSLNDVNRMFRSFTDYQFAEGSNILAEYNVDVQGSAVIFSGASISKTANAVITSANYTQEQMEIFYTYNYRTSDMAMRGEPDKIENKKAILKPNADGLYQIVKIEVVGEQAPEGQALEEQTPEEQVPEEPAGNTGFPAGTYSYVAQAGGFRGSITIDSTGTAIYKEINSGTWQGYEIKYQMSVDETAAPADGVTAYSLQFIEGHQFQMAGGGENEVTGYLESGQNMTFYYDANQGILQDAGGAAWVPVN